MKTFKAKTIIQYIKSTDKRITYEELVAWGRENKIEDVVTKHPTLYRALLMEHNLEKGYSTDKISNMFARAELDGIDREMELISTKSEKAWIVFDYIVNKPAPISVMGIVKWCCQNGYWSAFRDNSDMFIKYIAVKNE